MLKKFLSTVLSIAVTAASGVPAWAAGFDSDVGITAEEPAAAASDVWLFRDGGSGAGDLSGLYYRKNGLDITVSNCQVYKNNDKAADLFVAVYDSDCLVAIRMLNIPDSSESVQLDDFTITLNSEPADLKVKAFLWSADGKCEPFAAARELTEAVGDVYTVYGRVTATPKGGAAQGLNRDEVVFSIEKSENFDGRTITADSPEPVTAGIGSTKADDMLFVYSEALIAKDNESYTIVAITPCGDNQTVAFDANAVAEDDPEIGTDYTGQGAIPVYKSEDLPETNKYELASDAQIYVNGVSAGTATNTLISDYILKNETGSVTLIDVTAAGSTSNDGKYEYIMVDYYVDAVIDTVSITSDYARIYFKSSEADAIMQWNMSDEDINITFTKGGDEIACTDLAEYDVLSIAYDIINEGSDLTDNTYYDVKVSEKIAEGVLEDCDPERGILTVNGADYRINPVLCDAYDVEPGIPYILYLDAFGYIAYIEEGLLLKNYGVIVDMHTSPDKDYPVVRMVTADAETVEYECKDNNEADLFYSYATDGLGLDKGIYTFTKDDIKDNILNGGTVCIYELTGDNKLVFGQAMRGAGGDGLEFKANVSKLGAYPISDDITRIIDMEHYMEEGGGKVFAVSVDSFEDEAMYDAYLFDRNSNGDYSFAIVFSGIHSVRAESSMAIVEQITGAKEINGAACTELTVARDGQENIPLIIENGDVNICEGSVIAYAVGPDGYVESGDVYVLMDAGTSYSNQLTAILDNTNFAAGIKNVDIITEGRYAGFATPAYARAESRNVILYYGMVYKKSADSLELFTSAATVGNRKISSVNDTQVLSISGANRYVYDFGQNPNNRVSVGTHAQASSIFNRAYCTEDGSPDTSNDKNYVSWNLALAEDVTPAMALVKEVDGDVIDVMYFIAP